MNSRIRITLSRFDADRLSRPVKGQGGFQNLLRKLQNSFVYGSTTLEVDPEVAGKLAKFSRTFKRNHGGFQGRLAPITTEIAQVKRALSRR